MTNLEIAWPHPVQIPQGVLRETAKKEPEPVSEKSRESEKISRADYNSRRRAGLTGKREEAQKARFALILETVNAAGIDGISPGQVAYRLNWNKTKPAIQDLKNMLKLGMVEYVEREEITPRGRTRGRYFFKNHPIDLSGEL